MYMCVLISGGKFLYREITQINDQLFHCLNTSSCFYFARETFTALTGLQAWTKKDILVPCSERVLQDTTQCIYAKHLNPPN